MDSRYYRAPDELLWQGDLVEVAPSVMVQSFHQEVLRDLTIKGGRQVYERFPTDGPAPNGGFRFPSQETVGTRGTRTFAVLLNHDCDFDKKPAPKLVALARPLESAQEGASAIIAGNELRAFYLPENDGPDFPSLYVDLRHITTLHWDAVTAAERVVSMSNEFREAFRGALVQYFARGDER